jgi:hypothetical protein
MKAHRLAGRCHVDVEQARPVDLNAPFPTSGAAAGLPAENEVTNYRPGQYYRCTPDGHQLIVVMATVSEVDRQRFRSARIEFSAARSGALILILARVGELLPWHRIPYAWPLTPESQRMRYFVAGSWPADRSAALQLTLVDSGLRRVVGRRNLVCDSQFSGFLHEAIRFQAQCPFDAHEYVRAVAECALAPVLVPEHLGGNARRAVLTDGVATAAW